MKTMMRYSFWLTLGGVILVFAIILLADPLLALTPAVETPQAAARHAVCGTGLDEDAFRALGTRKSGEQVLVFYECRRGSDTYFGYAIMRRKGRGWNGGVANAATTNNFPPADRLVYHESGGVQQEDDKSYSFVYGRILAPEKVGAVEALFDNGETLRDEGTGGIFYLETADSLGVCELGLLDKGGKVVRRIDIVVSSASSSIVSEPMPSTSEGGGAAWIGASRATPDSCAKVR